MESTLRFTSQVQRLGHGLGTGEECLAAGMLDELVLIVAPGHAAHAWSPLSWPGSAC